MVSVYLRVFDELPELCHRNVQEDRPQDPCLLLQRKLPFSTLTRDSYCRLWARAFFNSSHQLCACELRLSDAVSHRVQSNIVFEQERDVQSITCCERERGNIRRKDPNHVRGVRDVLFNLYIEERVCSELVQRKYPVPEEVFFRRSHLTDQFPLK